MYKISTISPTMCMYKISTISPAMYKISTVSPTMYMYKISTISPASCMYSIKEDINAHSTLSQNSSETLRFAGADSTVCQAVLSGSTRHKLLHPCSNRCRFCSMRKDSDYFWHSVRQKNVQNRLLKIVA